MKLSLFPIAKPHSAAERQPLFRSGPASTRVRAFPLRVLSGRTAPACCPHLGLAGAAERHEDAPGDEHRCYLWGQHDRIDRAHQANFCLTNSHSSCPWLMMQPPAKPKRTSVAAASTQQSPSIVPTVLELVAHMEGPTLELLPHAVDEAGCDEADVWLVEPDEPELSEAAADADDGDLGAAESLALAERRELEAVQIVAPAEQGEAADSDTGELADQDDDDLSGMRAMVAEASVYQRESAPQTFVGPASGLPLLHELGQSGLADEIKQRLLRQMAPLWQSAGRPAA